MKQICLQAGLEDAAPRTNEISLYPDIDDTYEVVEYTGRRLVVRTSQVMGAKLMGTMQANLQGIASYGDKVVRMANGGTHYIYEVTGNGSFVQLATFSAGTGHSNSLQFAPSLQAGQSFPYLYVACLTKQCKVLSISSAYAVSIVQTITIGIAGVPDGCNLQIGDDGYLWAVCQDSAEHYRFMKFRRVAVSEGDVTLTSADLLEEWTTQEVWPYADYVWQGMTIRNGQVWFVYGKTGAGNKRGILVYDTNTHGLVTNLSLEQFIEEYEDCDFYGNSVILASYSSNVYILKF